MRTVKDAKERRDEILDAADELFSQKGFDKTSTNEILEKIGIARGTLYYHFKSKEDIMDALIKRYEKVLFENAEKIAKDKSIPVYERIVKVVKALNISEQGNGQIIDHMHKPQNALMHQKTQATIIKRLTPLLTGIIEEGIEKGLFQTPFPYECMEMAIIYASTIFDSDMIVLSNEQRKERMQAFIYNIGRMLMIEEEGASYLKQIFERKEV
ncbi:TetR/AcrR family transcriptional regulator [Candidatus Galacturonibacter soehngenii]|uniref:TetR/AcrR family transcriptional regulator n=1 Tax=Candidatus Galacturonatibacter soehngenii TaxID=2307010 RepID=A0A7V7QIF1_9FIRM|nr:TetR/AcrR family transcriptional regulator [Candidatus Galacturonibacter soehngenii]KAB1435977.1 TetR/AcrR family transcriptional regulator [Candidatus Galacturonibacter soehngenii]MBA4686287.1 TetR/AcrR family transcriptional regulator [Candidatus Galacturonibacter soehngenii]